MTRTSQSKEVVKTFTNLCATMIQANFKGYKQRKYYKKFLPVYRRFKQLLYAGFLGWKTRRCMNLSVVKSKMNDIRILRKQQKNMQLRIAKRDFCDQIARLLKNGLWISYLMKERKLPLTQRYISASNKVQSVSFVKMNLKQALKMIPKSNYQKVVTKKKQNQTQSVQNNKLFNQKQSTLEKSSNLPENNQKINLRNKKFEIPPKPIKKAKVQKQIETKIETYNNQIMSMKQSLSACQTPSQFLHQQKTKVYSFHTKPRNENSKIYQHVENQKIEPIFMKIDMKNYSSQRKGLNMTLSKNQSVQNKSKTTKGKQNTVQQNSLSRNNAQKQQKQQQNYSSLSTNFVTPFNQIQKAKEQIFQKQKVGKVQQKKQQTLQILDIKKQDFEKKKLEFQKRSQKFKAVFS